VRQVSTSNSVYVLEPSIARPESRDADEELDLDAALARPSSAMTAVTKVDTMLELIPLSHGVKAMLERVIPIYQTSEVLTAEEANLDFLSHSIPTSKSALFADIPAPDSHIEQSWRDMLAFEFEERCARPSASTSLSVWQSIADYATIERADLTQEANFNGFFQNEQIWPLHAPIAQAILIHLKDNCVPDSTAHSLTLDQLRTVRWTGLTLLQAKSEKAGSNSTLSTDEYVGHWQDLLPEAWRDDATLEKLPERCYKIEEVDGRENIMRCCSDDSRSASAQPAVSEATKATAGKRKWHEKFKAQRKEIKK
jgi:sister chromatid cohesion protein DCC1